MSLLRFTILGSGSSGGVPRANGDWGACDPSEPKNRRRRCSLLVERAETQKDLEIGEDVTRVLVDTSPDFREQMLSAGVRRLDAVVYTHDHADQTHGIDDLRIFVLAARKRMPVYTNASTAKSLLVRFGYAFKAPEGSPYPAIFDHKDLPAPGEPLVIRGAGGAIEARNYEQAHGGIMALGFRFGPVAYSPDVSAIPDESFNILAGIDTFIVDSLRDTPHGTHFSVQDALAAIERTQARRGVLTNLHIDLDYKDLSARTPEHVDIAYDGLQLVFEV